MKFLLIVALVRLFHTVVVYYFCFYRLTWTRITRHFFLFSHFQFLVFYGSISPTPCLVVRRCQCRRTKIFALLFVYCRNAHYSFHIKNECNFCNNFLAIFLCSFSFCFQMLAISEGQMPLSWPEEGMTYTTMTTTTSTTEKWVIESEEESKESEEENEEKVNISLIIFFLQSIIFKCWF